MKVLFQHGVDINAKDVHGSTPVLAASENGRLGTVKLLIEENADCDAADEQ